jgi:hypothetical protein
MEDYAEVVQLNSLSSSVCCFCVPSFGVDATQAPISDICKAPRGYCLIALIS